MSPILCPVCQLQADPVVQVATLAICGGCGSSLHLDGDVVRRATAAETTKLGEVALRTLRQARASVRRGLR